MEYGAKHQQSFSNHTCKYTTLQILICFKAMYLGRSLKNPLLNMLRLQNWDKNLSFYPWKIFFLPEIEVYFHASKSLLILWSLLLPSRFSLLFLSLPPCPCYCISPCVHTPVHFCEPRDAVYSDLSLLQTFHVLLAIECHGLCLQVFPSYHMGSFTLLPVAVRTQIYHNESVLEPIK